MYVFLGMLVNIYFYLGHILAGNYNIIRKGIHKCVTFPHVCASARVKVDAVNIVLHTNTPTHMYAYTNTHKHTPAYTHTHPHTHPHTYTHKHTQTHIHMQFRSYNSVFAVFICTKN